MTATPTPCPIPGCSTPLRRRGMISEIVCADHYAETVAQQHAARQAAEAIREARSYLPPRTAEHGRLMDAEAALRQHSDRIDAEAAAEDWEDVFRWAEARTWDVARRLVHPGHEVLRRLAVALHLLGATLAEHAEGDQWEWRPDGGTVTVPARLPRERGASYALRVRRALAEAGVPALVTRHEAARLLDGKAPRRWEGDHGAPVSLSEVAARVAGVKR